MSLRVWLPLNGDPRQQGASTVAATVSGATVNTSGKIGSCYSFDGSDDYISLEGSELYSIIKGGSYPFSISFWVYHNDTTRAIIFGDYGLSGAIGFNVELSSTHQVRFYWNGSPDKTFGAESNVAVQGWSHIAITYSGTLLNIYKDGVLSSDSWSGTLAAKTKSSGVYYLGRDSRTGATTLNGRLNDFRIYDHCLSVAEVKEISQGLIVHYKLDSIENGIVDSSGYGYNGIVNGTLALSNTIIKYSNNIQFPGTAYIKITSPSTEIKTVSLWANWNSIPSGQSIIYVDQKSKTGLGLASNGIIVNANQTGNTFNKSNLVASTWYHFVIVSPNGSSNATRKLYINGIEQTALSSTNSWSYTIDELQLGKRSTSSDGFNGQISDFRMYCTALSAEDVLTLYQTSAKVDNKQNLHSREFVEDSTNRLYINKAGQVHSKFTVVNNQGQGFDETKTTTKFKKTNLIIETAQLIEF